jgi:hypothetical protein
MPRPRRGRNLLPAEPDGPSIAGRQGTNHQRNDHRAWSPRPSPAPWSSISRQPAQTHLRGTWAHLLLPVLPRQPTGTWRWTSSLVGQAANAAPQPVCIPSGGPGLASTIVPAAHGQRSTIPSPPGPIRATTTKPLTDQSDTSNPVHQPWPVPPHPCIPDPARCGQRGCSGRGHRTSVCPDTRITPVAWTPVAWTADVRPTSWTDVCPHGGQRTRTARRTAWPASGHPGRPRRRRPPAGRRKPRSGAASAARHPMTAPRRRPCHRGDWAAAQHRST